MRLIVLRTCTCRVISHLYRNELNVAERGEAQVGFAELKETADDRANIGGTIIGVPIVDRQLAQYILTYHQDADCGTMIRLISSREF